MTGANITKAELAKSMKNLMTQSSFDKITVSEICSRSYMSRKNFYYHFKDKYEMINWIFDTEFFVPLENVADVGWIDYTCDLCEYLCENKTFYKNVFASNAENSFFVHFEERSTRFLPKYSPISGSTDVRKDFLIYGVFCAVRNWLQSDCPVSPKKFAEEIKLSSDMVSPLPN